jgi:hypothetical protein
MDTTDIAPLRIIASRAQLYVNTSGDAKEVLLWVASHGAAGAIYTGPDNAPGHVIDPQDGTVVMKMSVEANESIRAEPGTNGIIAVRIALV